MSFCMNSRPDQSPGAICGNPMTGLCDKACIEVKKVFDACIKQVTLENQVLLLSNIDPPTAPPPYTFVSAQSVKGATQVYDVTITPLLDTNGCSRVQATVFIPIEVNMLDGNQVPAKAYTEINLPVDVVLYVPQGSVVGTELKALANAVMPTGTIVNDTLTATVCLTVMLKIVADVDLLIPTYGYCFIPVCQDYAEDVCSEVYDMPLFPQDKSSSCKCGNSK